MNNTLSNPENWNKFVGNIWADLFSRVKMSKIGKLIEIAPGSVNKIGYGLSRFKFRGDIYLVEPNVKSIKNIAEQYKELTGCKIVQVNRDLTSAVKILPSNVLAILSNHVLDDMIIGKSLSEREFTQFFDSHYSGAAEITEKLWNRLAKNSRLLEKIKKNIVLEWKALIKKTKPDWVILSQYKSFFFRKNKLDLPDKHAFDVLNRIRKEYSRYELKIEKINNIDKPERWLVLDFRK